jgi:chaperonin GroES
MSIACLQFHARAYPALIPSKGVVLAAMMGEDPDGAKQERVDRVTTHMNYQILFEMEDWEDEMDKLLITLPMTGSEFKKTYYDPSLGRNVSKHIRSKDLVLHYYSKNVETAARKTEIIEKRKNEIMEGVNAGLYLNILSDLSDAPAAPRTDLGDRAQDAVQGTKEPKEDDDTPHKLLEWHGYYDLDCDGYKEPYICLVHKDTKKVLRIVARFQKDNVVYDDDGKVVIIKADEYYTQYIFIPSPDGGVYGMGFGTLIGPINKAVNTLINQLIDAGTLQNRQSGFISRNLRIKGGSLAFQPGEWKQVNATGQDLQQGILPLRVNQPSAVLFELLGMLITAGERLTSTTDMMVGENPGQNQKATTTQAVLDQGMKVFTAIYKRVRHAMGREFRKLFWINSLYLDETEYFNVLDINTEGLTKSERNKVMRSDYSLKDMALFPTADPNSVTQQSKMEKAQFIFQLAQQGLLAMQPSIKRLLEAAEIDNLDELIPQGLTPLEQAQMQAAGTQQQAAQHEMELSEREMQVKEKDSDTKALDVILKAKGKDDEIDLKALEAGLNANKPAKPEKSSKTSK